MILLSPSLLASKAVEVLWRKADAAEIVFGGVPYLFLRDNCSEIWIQRSDGHGPRMSLQEWQELVLGTGQCDDRARHLAAIINTGASLN